LTQADTPAGFFALHVEVDELEDVLAGAEWLEVQAERQERPVGREIISVRWANWPFQVGLYRVRPGYWAWPPRQRIVAIARCPNLQHAREALAAAGWTMVHQWRVDGREGCYFQPPVPLRVILTVQPGPERLTVRLAGTDLAPVLN
jgi:hypothetical protein